MQCISCANLSIRTKVHKLSTHYYSTQPKFMFKPIVQELSKAIRKHFFASTFLLICIHNIEPYRMT